MRKFRYRWISFVLLALSPFSTSAASPLSKQNDKSSTPAPPVCEKLPLRAALVLTPEFCATKWTKGNGWTSNKEAYTIGSAACNDLEPALQNAFLTLTRVEAVPASGDAQVVLQPKVLSADATKGRKREMVVLFEWTVTDASGKTVWVQTVQGTAKHKRGSGINNKNFKLLLDDSVQDAAEESAREMSNAPELKNLGQSHTAPETGAK